MQQEVSLQHEELAQAHQLGELQKEYRVRIDKTLLIFGAGLINTYVLVNDGSRIELSPYISGIGELRSTIKREMANHRSGS